MGGPCYHMTELLGKAGHVDLWLDVAAGKPDWDAIFDGYVATVDFPASNYWRELAEVYPDAKIILSKRDAERWFASTQETIFSPTIGALHAGTKWGRMVSATVNDFIGGDVQNKGAVIDAFNAHNAAVEKAFDPDRLLVFEASQGWKPLCDFLGVDAPSEPFPHINSRAEFQGVIELLKSPIGPDVLNGEGINMPGSMHDEAF